MLRLENVSVIRGDRLGLDRLTLCVPQGRHLAILGPNGSGKSTLIQVIARECYPLAQPGTVCEVLGRQSWNIFELRSQIGLVSNDLMRQVTRDITGRELVISSFFGSIGLWPHQTPTPEMETTAQVVMRQLNCGHLAVRWLDELSSGEARRLLLARALIHRPSTLLLDEPTSSLDLTSLHEFRAYLRLLAQSGVTLILVTHHLDDIIPEVQHVALLDGGRVVREGAKADLLTASNLHQLFQTPVDLVTRDGYFHAW